MWVELCYWNGLSSLEVSKMDLYTPTLTSHWMRDAIRCVTLDEGFLWLRAISRE